MTIEYVEIDRFVAIDQNGQSHIVVILQSYDTTLTHSGASRTAGMKKPRTVSGQELDFINENTFYMPALGLTLKRS